MGISICRRERLPSAGDTIPREFWGTNYVIAPDLSAMRSPVDGWIHREPGQAALAHSSA